LRGEHAARGKVVQVVFGFPKPERPASMGHASALLFVVVDLRGLQQKAPN
jgi:hypothetical protein